MKYILKGKENGTDYLKTIFENRGIEVSKLQSFIRTTDDDINDAEGLDNIQLAAEKVHEHIEKDSKILIVIDSDVDGFTSSAVLWNFLKKVKPDANLFYVGHEGKQHGLSPDIMSYDLKQFGLVIVPDAGTNDFEQHKILKDMGVDVIILDHHDADGYSEDAIVVNSQLSENYENKMFSGAGITWQFVRFYNDFYKLGVDVDYYLDLVALGNVADMMSVKSLETKHLMHKGFANVNNPMFAAFIDKQSYSMKGEVTPKSVSWFVGPLINAMIRVGTQEEKEMMFSGFLEENRGKEVPSTKRGAGFGDTEFLQEQIARLCANARNKQNKIVEAGMATIEKEIEEQELNKNTILILPIKNGSLPPELVGLVANKIAGKYQQPTLIVRKIKDVLMGSGRNYNNSSIEDFRGELEESKLVSWGRGKLLP